MSREVERKGQEFRAIPEALERNSAIFRYGYQVIYDTFACSPLDLGKQAKAWVGKTFAHPQFRPWTLEPEPS